MVVTFRVQGRGNATFGIRGFVVLNTTKGSGGTFVRILYVQASLNLQMIGRFRGAFMSCDGKDGRFDGEGWRAAVPDQVRGRVRGGVTGEFLRDGRELNGARSMQALPSGRMGGMACRRP